MPEKITHSIFDIRLLEFVTPTPIRVLYFNVNSNLTSTIITYHSSS
jgi:hypothetical protein